MENVENFLENNFEKVSFLVTLEQLVSPDPVIDAIERKPGEDDFIAICCDGIFDVMENDHLKDIIYKRIPYKEHITELCEEIADYSCHKVTILSIF